MPAAGPAVAATPAAAEEAPVEVCTNSYILLVLSVSFRAVRSYIIPISVGETKGEDYLQRQARVLRCCREAKDHQGSQGYESYPHPHCCTSAVG